MWLNFSTFRVVALDNIWFPVIFIGIVVAILFFPAPVLYSKSRKWFLYSNVSLHAHDGELLVLIGTIGSGACCAPVFIPSNFAISSSAIFTARRLTAWAYVSPQTESILNTSNTYLRTLNYSSASTAPAGPTLGNATQRTPVSSASSRHCQESGDYSSVSDDIMIRATSSHILSTAVNTHSPSSTT